MFGVQGLHTHISRNHGRSLVLFLGFLAAVEILALGAYLPVRLLGAIIARTGGPDDAPADPLIWFLVGGLVIGALWFFMFLGQNVRKAREIAGFAFAEGDDERRLRRRLEPLAIAAGLPTPRLAVIETDARNAFACGLTPREAVIVVTRGLMQALDEDEMTAVLAHELAHVRNGDIRLLAFAFAAQEAIQAWGKRFAPLLAVRAWIVLLISPVHLLMLAAIVASSLLGAALAMLSRLLISRAREFIADAEAIRLTKDATALVSALRKIDGRSALNDAPAAIEAMLIDGASTGALATHPTITERIAALRAHAGGLFDIETPKVGGRPPQIAPSAAGAALASLAAIAGSAIAAIRPAPLDPVEVERRKAYHQRVVRWAGVIVGCTILFNLVSALTGAALLSRPEAKRRPQAAAAVQTPAQPADGWILRRD